MRIYFQIKGDFKNRNINNTFFDYISFSSMDKDYCLDLSGEVDAEFGSGFINGRIKASEKNLLDEDENVDSIRRAIMNMDNSSIEFGVVDSDVDDFIKYDSAIFEFWIGELIKKVII